MSSPSGLRSAARPPKGFPLFSAHRMAYPDTVILLIVDHHAAIGGTKNPVPPCVPGADPELVSRGRSPCRAPLPSPPLPTLIPPLPPSFPPLSLPVPPLPSLSFPSLLPFPFPSLSSPPFAFPPLPLKRGSGGPPPENFEILDCCR